MKNIGFIGAGNMGGAMAQAIGAAGFENTYIYDVNSTIYSHFKEVKNIIIAQNMQQLVSQVKYVVLSVKPQYYDEVCSQIRDYLTADHVIITVSPGHSLQMMKVLVGEKIKLIRTMPNTPALIGEGVTAYTYYLNELVQEEVERFLEFFNSFGKTFYIDEKLMSAVVATTGSSPAYGYMFIEAMADAAVSFGMPRYMAYEMAALAIKGACEMILQTKKHPGELKDAVTSPGGTTIQAVTALEEAGFRNSVIKAMTACYHKANQMGQKS